ncbi:MAG TPA: ribonuclease III [Phycisphaerae bacterium]|nr:ribonuclease III [Phycisphaerae bacterium]
MDPDALPLEPPFDDIVARCQAILGHRFNNHTLLKEALTHASIADDRRLSNERLEFLGDSVLGLVVCHRLFELFPDYLEGDLTKLKSAVVSRNTCAAVANAIGLTDLIFVGKGMMGRKAGGNGVGSPGSGAEMPSSLAAGVLESIIAAIYLDGGFTAVSRFILTHMDPYIEQFAATTHQQNFKSLLQQHAQKNMAATPMYELLDEKGPDHSKCFEVRVVIGAQAFGSAWGSAKKQAEQKAAQNALEELGVLAREGPLPSEVAAAEAGDTRDDSAGDPQPDTQP